MTLRTRALLATLAAAAWSIAPAAIAQAQEESPPSPSAAQDPTTEDPTTGRSATEQSTQQQSTQQMPPGQQSPDQSAATSPSPAAGAPIDDKKIEQFADAYMAVHTIQQKASQQLQAASTPEEANKVKASAESEMIGAVERSGLQVPEFNRIVETMAADPNVRSRVAAKLQERTGGEPPQNE